MKDEAAAILLKRIGVSKKCGDEKVDRAAGIVVARRDPHVGLRKPRFAKGHAALKGGIAKTQRSLTAPAARLGRRLWHAGEEEVGLAIIGDEDLGAAIAIEVA